TRNGSLFGNDSDVEGDTIAVTQFVIEGDSTVYTPGQVATISGVGTLMINGTGSYSFVPDADYNGAIPNATYTIDDGNGGTDTAILAFSNISLVIDITPDNLSTNEDTSVLLDVLANDSFEASPLVTEFTQSTNGIVTLEADGTGSYTPNENFFGSDSFTYTVTSGGVTETTTVTINIIEQNDIPESVGIADQSAVDGQTVSIDLSNRFSDVDADDLTFSSTVLPSGLSIDPTTGVISGTLDNSASQHGPTNNGIYEVSITALDGRGGSAEETFTYTIVNALPTAVNDDVVTEEDTSATINVLVNDGNPDSDSLTVTEAVAAHGTLVINFDNSITYTPDIDFNGSDTIIYRIIDGDGGESTASVNVTVTPANDDPTSSGIANQADADSSSINLDVSANFSDIDGDDLSFSVAGLPPGLSIDAVTGVITGTVPNDVSITGPYTVTVTADDGNGGSVDTSFTWAFENIPPIADDDFATTAEDTFVIISVLDNDTDPDGDPLSVVEASAANGTIVINGGNTITYTPDADFIGTDSINYRISDGAGSFSTATVTVTVTPANDAPIVNTPLPAEAAIDGQTVSINFSPYFSDVDGDTLSFTATGLPSGISIDANTGVVSGTFENNASVSSPYNITITASDDSGATVSESFDWSVANPPLQANPDVKDVFENATITVTATDGVLNNDLDPDGDSLTVSAVENNTVNVGQAVAGSNGGTFVINADGSYSFNASTDFDDLPEAGSRTTSIIYQASDGEGGLSTATLTLTVTGGNDDPIASADNPTTDEDLAVNGVVSATDTEADTLTFALTAAPTNGTVIVNADGSYVYTPNDNFNGTDTFTVTVEDGNGGSDIATVTVDVASINDAPVIVGDSQTTNEDTSVTGTVTATDIDNDPLNLSVTTEANNGNVILDPSGSYTYTPNADFNGTDSFAITVDDGNGGTNTVVVNINVSADNDAPTASTLIIGNVNDSEIVNIDTRSAFDDIDGDTLTYSANGLPDELSINTNTGQITGTLSNNASQSSPYNVTVTSNDGKGGEVSTTFTLTVNNIAPVAQDDVFTGDEDQVITGNLRSNDNDPDNDITSIDTTPVSGPSQGTVILSSDGSFTYTPNADANGTDSFTYRLIDSNGESSEATVTFVTTAVNDIPVVLNDTVQTDEDTPITINVLANDIDVDGDALNVISVDGQPTLVGRMVLLISGDSVVLNADGTLTFTPAHNTNGETSFEYQVIDAEGERVTGTVNISVTAIPDSTDINQSLEIGQQEISTVQIFEAEATETTPSDDRFISAPGIVLETVFDVRDLHSTVNLTAGAPIQTAVNDLQSLNSNENLLQVEHPILEAMRNLDNFSLFNQRITEIFDADINPFESDSDKLEDDDQEINSLLIPAGDSANNKTTEELSIETIVRNQALLMSVRSMANNSESTIINYNVTRVDGRALPDWISLDNKGLALLEAPEQMKDIQLNIHAIDASGISTIYPVELDLFSGKIAQLDFPEQVDIDTFDNRISQEAYGSSVETAALMQALNTTRFQ
ncbi:Ig-like domain-containing protein, partial [Pseudocolwellia sp. AS88]